MTVKDSLTLRRANADEAEFAFRVLKETMREYAMATWGAFQRHGFGTQLLTRLFVEARKSNLPIRLRVLAVNPA